MKQVIAYLRKDAVLCIALLLAVISGLFVHPDLQYAEYIDFRTLAILFCLMAVMAGLQELGVFKRIAWCLLGMVSKVWQLLLVLVLECFFFSMLITNDVALITFVPFTLTILELLGEERRQKLLIPVVVMETVAANLGSMLTPIGNPQNLYLYGRSGLGLASFMKMTAPYAAAAFVLLTGWCLLHGMRDGKAIEKLPVQETQPIEKKRLILYLLLFVVCLLSVTRLVPYQVSFVIVLAAVLLSDRKILGRIDYNLLLTFVGFFIFVGNLGRMEAFRSFLENMMLGREVLTAVLASQVISNVPAALLLSGFTADTAALVVGTNLGGLGTLIASMASLISFKAVSAAWSEKKGLYLLYFTVVNVLFLAALLGVWILVG